MGDLTGLLPFRLFPFDTLIFFATLYKLLADILNSDSLFFALVSAVWIMLPPVPNPAAVIFGGGPPIDGGATWRDGRRLFGEGKTVRGFILGVLAGVAVGGVEALGADVRRLDLHLELPPPPYHHHRHRLCGRRSPRGSGKSFVKRRIGKGQGDPWPVADQYDLVVGAFLLTALVAPQWLLQNITLPVLIWILVLTPVLHRVTNIAGHRLGVKRVPW